jgi:hypothetical protein
MVKLNSTNTLAGEQLIAQAVAYMKHWSQNELSSLITKASKNNEMPIIAPVGKKGYLVGNYAMQLMDNGWWKVTYKFTDSIYIFTTKLSAICFTVLQQTNRKELAEFILRDDLEVGRLTIKAEQFYFRLTQAQKKKDNHKISLFLVRYQETSTKLNHFKSNLEKSLKSAKYFKF